MPHQAKKLRFIISGGGTGGHIFPAIAIANALKKIHPETEILFVGAKNRMEMDKVPKAGYPIKGLWISGIQRKLTLKNLSFPFKLIHSIFKSFQIIKKFKPHCVIGVGGYASGPLLWAAQQKKIPTIIQEQNSFPGITNKFLAKKVSLAFVAYQGLERFFPADKIRLFGNPVRQDLLETKGKRAEALAHFNLDKNKKTILLIGGSQGARGINLALENQIEKIVEANVQLIWQTGKPYLEEAKALLGKFKKHLIQPIVFIERMDLAYAAADILISRAGAGAISEIAIVRKPTVFVPLPSAAEDHQTKNAKALVEKDAAILIPQNQANEKLVPKVLELLANEQEQNKISKNLAQFDKKNAADEIAKEIFSSLN